MHIQNLVPRNAVPVICITRGISNYISFPDLILISKKITLQIRRWLTTINIFFTIDLILSIKRHVFVYLRSCRTSPKVELAAALQLGFNLLLGLDRDSSNYSILVRRMQIYPLILGLIAIKVIKVF